MKGVAASPPGTKHYALARSKHLATGFWLDSSVSEAGFSSMTVSQSEPKIGNHGSLTGFSRLPTPALRSILPRETAAEIAL